jgi:hypothetical protein
MGIKESLEDGKDSSKGTLKMSEEDLQKIKNRHTSSRFDNLKERIGLQYFVQLANDLGIDYIE